MSNPSITRYLADIAFANRYGRQMRFITGPRQSGKTYLAKEQLKELGFESLYYDWDRRDTRTRYRNETAFFESDALRLKKKPPAWVCFDEIHKYRNWKNILKEFFDGYETKTRFIVTGSARLETFRRSGDSLAGRYFLFHLNPLMIGEITGKPMKSVLPESDATDFIEKSISGESERQDIVNALLANGPFPEPHFAGDSLFTKKWRESYLERIVKEDLRDITQIRHLEKVIDLVYLLPGRIASPLSLNSLREDLEINFATAKSYLNYLNICYVIFEILPFSWKKTRLVKKEKKVYFYDYTIVENEGARFENLVALELKAWVDLCNDATGDTFALHYVRTREGTETDFLIIRKGVPWLLLETKLSESSIERHHFRHAEMLGGIPVVQLVKEPNVLKALDKKTFLVSAGLFFS
jgi:uncharacterized protein